jgi:nucleoside 2-deoxyribosyltransferase
MDQIDWSDVVLADFTLGSRNVYFELGYARGKGKRILQTARTDAPREFDVRNWKTIVYRNATELEEKLKPAFQAAYVAVTAG